MFLSKLGTMSSWPCYDQETERPDLDWVAQGDGNQKSETFTVRKALKLCEDPHPLLIH